MIARDMRRAEQSRAGWHRAFGAGTLGPNPTQVLISGDDLHTNSNPLLDSPSPPTGVVKSDAKGSDLSMNLARRW